MPAIPPSRTPRRHDTRRVGQVRRAVLAISLTAGVILAADALFGERGLLALVRTQQQVASLEADIDRAEAENERIRRAVIRLQQDPAAIEELARRELGLIKPGEKLFIIRDVPSPQLPR